MSDEKEELYRWIPPARRDAVIVGICLFIILAITALLYIKI